MAEKIRVCDMKFGKEVVAGRTTTNEDHIKERAWAEYRLAQMSDILEMPKIREIRQAITQQGPTEITSQYDAEDLTIRMEVASLVLDKAIERSKRAQYAAKVRWEREKQKNDYLGGLTEYLFGAHPDHPGMMPQNRFDLVVG